MAKKILIIFLFCLFLSGCEEKPLPQILRSPPIPEERRLPIDYVFLLDNSGSIPKGEARAFAREAIKAFIDLTETEDKVSIITFDRGTQIIASEMVRDETSRNNLKDALESKLTFKGSHTDISKGMALLKEQKSAVFRGIGVATPAVILISDGKLEPTKNLKGSYDNLIRDWQELSELSPFYTFGLGEMEIDKKFLAKETGRSLLTRMAKGSGGRFYPVRSVDELVETFVSVLRHIKGYGELTGKEVFSTDDSTSRLAFLVIKRLPDRQISRTRDIRLNEPNGGAIGYTQATDYSEGQTRIFWHQGVFYDLVMVDNPSPGKWSVSLEDGQPPKMVALIRNQVHLRYLIKRAYWNNERKVALAWLYDERTGKLSDFPCEINLRFDTDDSFQNTPNKMQLQKTKEGTYLALLRLGDKEPPVGEYLLEITAEDQTGFFNRKSPTLDVQVKQSYFAFNLPQGLIQKWPVFWKGLNFAAEIDSTYEFYPPFRDPPKISLFIDKMEKNQSVSLPQKELPWKKTNGKIFYQLSKSDLELGQYSAYYVMHGQLASGKEVKVESPEIIFTLVWPIWVWVGMAAIGIVIVVFLAYIIRPKLSGRLNFMKPDGKPPIILTKHRRAKKSFKGDNLRLGHGGLDLTDLQQTTFTISGKRKKGLKITVGIGNLSLTREEQTRPVTTTDLFRGDIISFTDSEVNYMIELISPKRLPRKKRR